MRIWHLLMATHLTNAALAFYALRNGWRVYAIVMAGNSCIWLITMGALVQVVKEDAPPKESENG